jgi:Na+/proline symporter
MSTLDWIILVLFLAGLIGIVLWVIKHKKDDTSDYFLSGRSETWLDDSYTWVGVCSILCRSKEFTMPEFLLKYNN